MNTAISATAMQASGGGMSDYGVSISQRLLKANDEFEPPKKKKYKVYKNVNDRLWGYFDEFTDYVYAGDSVNLRSVIRECPKFVTYFEDYDKELYDMIKRYNQFIEDAKSGECERIRAVFKAIPAFSSIIHAFVGNIDMKTQCEAIKYFAVRDNSEKLMQYIRGRAETLTKVNARLQEITASTNRKERVNEFNDLLFKVKEGDNVGIRTLRRTDPHLSSDIADIVECDRLINFETMLTCANEGNTPFMKHLVNLHPYLVNHIGDEGESILFNAVKGGHLSTVKVLTNSDLSITDAHGRTSLHFTCAKAMKPLTLYLIQNGAAVNAKDKDGNTPLHYICCTKKPSLTVIKMLISDGSAKINITNKKKQNCVDILLRNGHDSLANYVKSFHIKEYMKPPIHIKSAKEKKNDLICHKHLSYCCPCAVAKKKGTLTLLK